MYNTEDPLDSLSLERLESSDDSQETVDNDKRLVARKRDREVQSDDEDMSLAINEESSSDESLPLAKLKNPDRDVRALPRLDFDKSSSDEPMDSDSHTQTVRCPVCGLKFLRRSWLKQHLEEHKQPKPSSDSDISLLPVSQLVKCPICHKKFANQSTLDKHVKTIHKKNKHRDKKCLLCNERTADMDKHIKSQHGFSCKLCKQRFKFQTQLTEHISIEHPSCVICKKIFLTKRELLVHQKDHPEETFVPEESSSEEEEEEDEAERRDFKNHITCVTVERFSTIRNLINKNDFKTLTKDKTLLESLGLIMHGVKRGFIPLCSLQKLVLTNNQKKLLHRIAWQPTARLVMKERRDLSLLFDVLWKSVKYVSDVFQEYDT